MPQGDRCDSYVIHLFKIKLNFVNVQNIDYETACGIHKMSYKNLTIILNVGMLSPVNTNWGGMLSTVDLLIKVVCFVYRQIILST